MRVLVTGASGLLGHNICGELGSRHELFGSYRTHIPHIAGCTPVPLDITDSAQVGRIWDEIRPDLVVHSAAIAQPDVCERNPDVAHKAIVEATRTIAACARTHGTRLAYISTDLVFDGSRGNYTEEDPVRGISVYSNCKIAAEQAVSELGSAAVTLRIAILYGRANPYSSGFLGSLLETWRAGRAARLYTDQFRTPLFAPEVARVVEELIGRPDVNGTFHVAGAERLSRYDFGIMVAERVGVSEALVQKGSMYDTAAAAPRGADCSLVCEKLRRTLGIEPLSCAAGLDTLLREGHLAKK